MQTIMITLQILTKARHLPYLSNLIAEIKENLGNML